ncbi:hypothetical protein HYALB_00003046 [Hymenoscyphus albidus]|uniref:Transmembrane protein n=1 Tax=Hymenoscyphus albidus TaxID=595503 RepID=A0A9N9LYM0_9HELO|nr:hypothetical protein HYALB_00003046 [Hymenoscyphus albidus]
MTISPSLLLAFRPHFTGTQSIKFITSSFRLNHGNHFSPRTAQSSPIIRGFTNTNRTMMLPKPERQEDEGEKKMPRIYVVCFFGTTFLFAFSALQQRKVNNMKIQRAKEKEAVKKAAEENMEGWENKRF